jgi:ketosteroid isomerase-like protein
MSQENVEVVRAVVDALNRQDFDEAFEHLAPDFVYDHTRAIGLDGGFYDREQARRLAEELMLDLWESIHWGVSEFIASGDLVVTPLENELVGRDGIAVRARVTWLWSLRDRKIERLCLYQDKREALEAAGLRE